MSFITILSLLAILLTSAADFVRSTCFRFRILFKPIIGITVANPAFRGTMESTLLLRPIGASWFIRWFLWFLRSQYCIHHQWGGLTQLMKQLQVPICCTTWTVSSERSIRHAFLSQAWMKFKLVSTHRLRSIIGSSRE